MYSLLFKGRLNLRQVPAIKRLSPRESVCALAPCTRSYQRDTELEYTLKKQYLNRNNWKRKPVFHLPLHFPYLKSIEKECMYLYTYISIIYIYIYIFTFALLWSCEGTQPLFSGTFTMPVINSGSWTFNKKNWINLNTKMTETQK